MLKLTKRKYFFQPLIAIWLSEYDNPPTLLTLPWNRCNIGNIYIHRRKRWLRSCNSKQKPTANIVQLRHQDKISCDVTHTCTISNKLRQLQNYGETKANCN